MKRSVVWMLLSYSILGVTATPVPAQEIVPERQTLVVQPGNDFRAALEKEGGLSRIYTGLRREKSIDFLMARATIAKE